MGDGWLPGWAVVLLGLLALALGVLLARLPLLWAAIGLLTVVLVVLTLIDPVVGLAVALVLGPTKPLTEVVIPQLPLDLGQIALIVTLGAWFLHAARHHRIAVPASPLTVPVLLFIGAAALSTLNALSIGYALKELLKWVQLLLVMWLVVDMGQGKPRRWWIVIGGLLAGAAIQAAVGVWQFGLRGDGPEHFMILGGYYRAYGTFEQPNPYGGFLGMGLSVGVGLMLGALGMWLRPVWAAVKAQRPVDVRAVFSALFSRWMVRLFGIGLLVGLLLAGLLASWSRGAWLGFAAAGAVMLLAWPRKAWVGVLLLVGGVVLGMLALQFNLLPASIADRLTGFTDFVQTFDVRGVDITTENYAVLERLAHWQTAQEMARYNLWLGVGIGNYEPVYGAYALMNWPQPLGHAHNIYLNLLAETGIIGLVAYLTMWIAVIAYTWRATRSTNIWQRSLAIGLLGAFIHLTAHQFVDKLYVANLHLHIGALFGVLTLLLSSHHSGMVKEVEAVDGDH